jgi:hypothetical protein
MTRPTIGVYDHSTGQQIIREMNDKEWQEWQDSQKPSEPKPLLTEQSTPIETGDE